MSMPLKPASILTVSAPSFWHSGRTTAGDMRMILAGLAPAAVLAALHWGGDAIRVIALSIAACVIFEALAQRLMERRITVDDYSAVVEGALLAFLLPAAAPWWLVIIGAALTILLAKMVFGGLGAAPLCAPLVGWAALAVSWPALIDPFSAQLSASYVDPLVRLKYFGAADAARISYFKLFIGAQLGALGASQAGALLLGGLFVLSRRIIRWQIPVAFLAGVVITSGVFHVLHPQEYAAPLSMCLPARRCWGPFSWRPAHPARRTGLWPCSCTA